MKKKLRWKVILVLAVLGVSVYLAIPPKERSISALICGEGCTLFCK